MKVRQAKSKGKSALMIFGMFFSTAPLSYSQITVTQSDFTLGGEVLRIDKSTNFDIDFLSTGANHNWNFVTDLQTSMTVMEEYLPASEISSISLLTFGPLAPIDYRASYFTQSTDIPVDLFTSYLPVTIDDIYAFYKVTEDSITSLGYSMSVEGIEIPLKSDTTEKHYEFPIQYENTTYSRGYTEINLNPTYNFIWRQHRTHTSVVDGWGSLTTPYGTFEVLRIAHQINEVDSIFSNQLNMWIPMSQIPEKKIYEWWTNDEKVPLLRIKTSSTLLGGETVTNVEFRNEENSKVQQLKLDELTNVIYPNPSKEEFSLKSKEDLKSMELIDLKGNIIKTFSTDQILLNRFNISNIESGVYYVRMIKNSQLDEIKIAKVTIE